MGRGVEEEGRLGHCQVGPGVGVGLRQRTLGPLGACSLSSESSGLPSGA